LAQLKIASIKQQLLCSNAKPCKPVQPDRQRIYHDPLHGAIALRRSDPVERLLIELIDTPAFQRLRRIRQLGPASLTFHGAESSRFTHSLGVMVVARRAFDGLCRQHPALAPYRATVLCAALLHDVGHGPFSHTSEEIFASHHETWTVRIVRQEPRIHQLLTALEAGLPEALVQVYRKCHPWPVVSQLVSSQLDCDRLDYLMRDSYFSGASYGHLDLDRILAALDFDADSGELAVARKGLAAIEHYLVVRSFMYSQVYNHPKNIAANWVLEQIASRARGLSADTLFLDATMAEWLFGTVDDLPLERYLAMDDTVCFYHLERWRQSPDLTLADLCRRYLDRDLLKARGVSDYPPELQRQLLEQSRSLVEQQGWDSAYYTGLRVTHSRGYSPYRQGIKLQTEQGLCQISERSPLIRALIPQQQSAWLIYPREIEADLEAYRQQLLGSLPTRS
jgi:uncharacterized protein